MLKVSKAVLKRTCKTLPKPHDKDIRLRGAYIQRYLTTYFNKESDLLANLRKKKSVQMIVMKPGLDLNNWNRPEHPLIPAFGQWCEHDKDDKYAPGWVIGDEERNAQGNDQCLKVPLLQLIKSNEKHIGFTEKHHVFSYSKDRKIVVKELMKEDIKKNKHFKDPIKEVTAMVHVQETGVSPKIHFILEKDDRYDVYMEMIFPGKTLEQTISEILKSDLDIAAKFVHFVVYHLILRMNEIWHKGWTHGDLSAANVMIDESDRCINLRIIDFGDAEEIETVTSETVKRDLFGIHAVVKEMLNEICYGQEDKFGLGKYEKTLTEYLSLEETEKLKKEVMTMAINFGKDRVANEEIIKLIS